MLEDQTRIKARKGTRSCTECEYRVQTAFTGLLISKQADAVKSVVSGSLKTLRHAELVKSEGQYAFHKSTVLSPLGRTECLQDNVYLN
jgi:hypothetical protein